MPVQMVGEQIENFNTSSNTTYVTEQGDIEEWKVNDKGFKKRITEELQGYIEFLKNKLE